VVGRGPPRSRARAGAAARSHRQRSGGGAAKAPRGAGGSALAEHEIRRPPDGRAARGAAPLQGAAAEREAAACDAGGRACRRLEAFAPRDAAAAASCRRRRTLKAQPARLRLRPGGPRHWAIAMRAAALGLGCRQGVSTAKRSRHFRLRRRADATPPRADPPFCAARTWRWAA
jgi:hypothetical protein